MIHEVDEALRALVRRDALQDADVEVAFDAPTSEWAARRTAPAVDIYLYDVREDRSRREVGYESVRNGGREVSSRRTPPRYFKLAYLITAWTQRPEDEHRLLSLILAAFLRYEVLPPEILEGSLAELARPVVVSIALPPPEDRSLSDVWSALGGELKAALDLVVIAPVDTARILTVGPPVLETPRLNLLGSDGTTDAPPPKRRTRRVGEADEPVQEETVSGGTRAADGRMVKGSGRVVRVKGVRRP